MLQTAPEYEDIPQFTPNRESPIYRRFVRRYNCRENVALKSNNPASTSYDPRAFNALSYKINSEGPDMVIRNIRLVMPLDMALMSHKRSGNAVLSYDDMEQICMSANENVGVQAGIEQNPMSAVAVAANPMAAFRTVECYINGKRFTKNFKARSTAR